MKFKIDENLPVEVAHVLNEAGYHALTVLDQSLGGEVDRTLAQVCQQEARILVTLDLDFADIRTYPPADMPGLIVLRVARQDKDHVLTVVRQLLPLLKQEPIIGRLWIVDEHKIRIRE